VLVKELQSLGLAIEVINEEEKLAPAEEASEAGEGEETAGEEGAELPKLELEPEAEETAETKAEPEAKDSESKAEVEEENA
jgi:DNA-directed RNA polymerase subunit beta